MQFSYINPTQIEFGQGKIEKISELISKEEKVLVLYGGGSIKKNGVYDQIKSALEDFTWFEFGGIEPNPKKETLDKAIAYGRENNVDFVLAVGGGSVIDDTKVIEKVTTLLEKHGFTHFGDRETIDKAVVVKILEKSI